MSGEPPKEGLQNQQKDGRQQGPKTSHVEPSVKVFPMSSVKRIIDMEMKEFGSITRVSADASIVLYDALLKHGRQIARRAIEYALKEGRKTVSDDDVKKAVADILI